MSVQPQMPPRRGSTKRRLTVANGVISDSHDKTVPRMAVDIAASRDTERRSMIATAAYYRAERRGFEPGHELEDWLAAETEVASVRAVDTTAPSNDSTGRRMS